MSAQVVLGLLWRVQIKPNPAKAKKGRGIARGTRPSEPRQMTKRTVPLRDAAPPGPYGGLAADRRVAGSADVRGLGTRPRSKFGPAPTVQTRSLSRPKSSTNERRR